MNRPAAAGARLAALLPREHGAYGQLAFPLAVSLAIGRPRWPALALAACGVAVFLAHEPLLVILGQRGGRASRQRAGAARWWLGACGAAALVLGGAGAWSVGPVARAALLAPAVVGGAVVVLILSRREHTTAGEVVSATALSLLAAPVALAAEAPPLSAWTSATVFALGFWTATVTVRAVIAAGRARDGGRARRAAAALFSAVGVAAMFALGRVGVVSNAGWRILSIQAVANVALIAVSPSPRNLRYVGWGLVAVSTLTAVLLVATLR